MEHGFQTGKRILEGLELGSPVLWRIAEGDLFAGERRYPCTPKGPFVYVMSGSDTYGHLKGLVAKGANEHGSDGTIRTAAASRDWRWPFLEVVARTCVARQRLAAGFDASPEAARAILDAGAGLTRVVSLAISVFMSTCGRDLFWGRFSRCPWALSPPRSSRLSAAERGAAPAQRAASRASDSFRRPSHSPLISQRTAIGTAAMLMPASPSPRSPMPAYTQAPIWSPAR